MHTLKGTEMLWGRMAARPSWDCNGMSWSLKPTAVRLETVFVARRGETTRAMMKDSGSWKVCGCMEVEPPVLLQWKLASATCYTTSRDSEYKAKRRENKPVIPTSWDYLADYFLQALTSNDLQLHPCNNPFPELWLETGANRQGYSPLQLPHAFAAH